MVTLKKMADYNSELLMEDNFYLFLTVAPEPVANCTTINPSAEHFRLSCKPGFDGGMEQFFEVLVRENNSGALVFNVTTSDIEKLDIDNLNAGLSYIATGIVLNAQAHSKCYCFSLAYKLALIL